MDRFIKKERRNGEEKRREGKGKKKFIKLVNLYVFMF